MANGSWLVSGGLDSTYYSTNTQEYTEGNAFKHGHDLPLAVHEHCIVRLDDTRYFLAGGMSDLDTQ